ncbi:histone H1-beta, late embryonic-like [Zeugodacus cucurbitae]|uniref:histone H1-beta, late embryonic-like n=1 Tax=Zeugodacus cucurbitae TaxID=28588 RepID=UPI0010A7409A|nr:histone H1-beta, late embryonic-like [Zeugodacus cucurbitae]
MHPNAHSTLMDGGISTRSNKHNLPTTKKMLEEAIQTLNCHRGFSLYRLKKYICEKYQIDLTTQRQNMIKTQLRAQLVDGTLINVTGKGLSGLLRESKKKKRSTSNTIATDAASKAIKRKKVVGKSKSAITRSASQDTTRTPPNVTVQPLVPFAPHRNSMAGHSHLEAGGATPCTSGGRVGRKRKLLPPPEDIVISQEY